MGHEGFYSGAVEIGTLGTRKRNLATPPLNMDLAGEPRDPTKPRVLPDPNRPSNRAMLQQANRVIRRDLDPNCDD